MAKGSKGRKGGGGGGGKTRKYSRDNKGRFASTGTGATARGGRLKTASGNKRKTQTMQSAAAPKGTIGKPRGLKPGSIKPKSANTPVRKVDTSASAIARRRSRANAPKASTYLSQRLNTQSAITRSAANEIYNRQRTVAKSLGGRVDSSVARSGIGAIQGLTGSKKQRADQLRERARKRVVGGRRR